MRPTIDFLRDSSLDDMSTSTEAVLFIFAHQDDEFGVFQCIKQAIRDGQHVCCAYLTDGGLHSLPARRNQESLYVLTQLGVNESDIFFAGEKLSIKDGNLVQHLNVAAAWLQNWLANYSTIKFIYVSAWEGGHHDHDALHAITLLVAYEKNILHHVRQFPLYNTHACPGPLFRVFSPLLENGALTKRKIPWRNRLHFMRLCFSYPSQAKTWLGLFPFVMLHYLLHGVELSQPVSLERLLSRPHPGPLYYEKRNFLSWQNMRLKITEWQENKL